ncbi:uncharacterized protein [Lepidochelys kempii]|uniref:uncharacterized protein n=1 Tax=Lepidochelys kempii TaxID=8472 RepID=UPI003C6F585E
MSTPSWLIRKNREVNMDNYVVSRHDQEICQVAYRRTGVLSKCGNHHDAETTPSLELPSSVLGVGLLWELFPRRLFWGLVPLTVTETRGCSCEVAILQENAVVCISQLSRWMQNKNLKTGPGRQAAPYNNKAKQLTDDFWQRWHALLQCPVACKQSQENSLPPPRRLKMIACNSNRVLATPQVFEVFIESSLWMSRCCYLNEGRGSCPLAAWLLTQFLRAHRPDFQGTPTVPAYCSWIFGAEHH